MTMTTSFNNDIKPLFTQFEKQMMWRFNLTNYDHVKANAQLIYGFISSQQMPPPPYDPLTLEQIQLFERWMKDGCKP